MLTKSEIKKRLGTDIIIKPYNKEQLNPNSYNVRLDDTLFVYEEEVIDLKKEYKTKEIKIPQEGLVLEPNKLYVGKTMEYTETYNLVPMIDGRSGLGRIGLFTNTSAGFGDVGYKGKWSLQLSCIHPIKIYPGIKIAQIYYEEITGEPENYNGKYQNTDQVTTSKHFEELK